MKNLFIFLLLSFLFLNHSSFAQEEGTAGDSVEIFLIDSYITNDMPYKFILSFFTSMPAKSTIRLDGKYNIKISDEFTEDHKAEIDISAYRFDSTRIPFVINVTDSLGRKFRSEVYDVSMPSEYKQEVRQSPNILLMCCFGGVIFGLPSPTYVNYMKKDYLSLTKEIPIVALYTESSRYPVGYFSTEYAYVFNAPVKNFLRAGYKHIFEIPLIEFVSPGINGFTDFKGFNGVSTEVTLGLFKVYEVFTVFSRYRYNFKPGETATDFHELSIGLYSNFFTFHLGL